MELSQFFLTFHYFQFVYCPNIKLFKIEKKINFFLLLQRWKCGGNKLQLIFNQVCNSLIECSLKIVEQSLKLPGESGSRRSKEGCQPKMILFQIILFTLLKRGFEGRSVSSQGNYSFNLNISQINNTKFLVVGCKGSGGVISKKPFLKKRGVSESQKYPLYLWLVNLFSSAVFIILEILNSSFFNSQEIDNHFAFLKIKFC